MRSSPFQAQEIVQPCNFLGKIQQLKYQCNCSDFCWCRIGLILVSVEYWLSIGSKVLQKTDGVGVGGKFAGLDLG